MVTVISKAKIWAGEFASYYIDGEPISGLSVSRKKFVVTDSLMQRRFTFECQGVFPKDIFGSDAYGIPFKSESSCLVRCAYVYYRNAKIYSAIITNEDERITAQISLGLRMNGKIVFSRSEAGEIPIRFRYSWLGPLIGAYTIEVDCLKDYVWTTSLLTMLLLYSKSKFHT